MEAGWLSRVEALYHDYIHTAEELEMNRPLGAGLFGLTPGPADDPCHERFAQELEALRASSAFRLGRVLTAPLRALKRLIRKLRGH